MYYTAWTQDNLQYPLEVELRINIWIKYVPSAWWQSQNSSIILLSFMHHLSTFRIASIYAMVLIQKTQMSKSEDLEIFMCSQANAIGSHLEYVWSEQNYATSASLKWNILLVKQCEWMISFNPMGSGIASSSVF